jgi:hypothetical protein
MSRPDEYRECAAQCLRLANSAWDAKDKAPLITMAAKWLDLADRFDGLPWMDTTKLGKPTTPPSEWVRH